MHGSPAQSCLTSAVTMSRSSLSGSGYVLQLKENLEEWENTKITWAHCSFSPSWCFGQVEFERPGVAASILIYLAYDGEIQNTGEQCKKTVSIQLCDTSDKNHTIGAFHRPFNHIKLVWQRYYIILTISNIKHSHAWWSFWCESNKKWRCDSNNLSFCFIVISLSLRGVS